LTTEFEKGKQERKAVYDSRRLAMLQEQKRLSLGELLELSRLERKVNRS
jgi:hypothetical protein